MRTLTTIALAAALAALTAAEAARACSCGPLPEPKQALADADAVFTATVVAIESTQSNRQVRLRVAGVWKGARCGEMTLTTGLGDSDCGYDFQVGTSYLIYAYEGQGSLTTNICTRTASLARSGKDLAALGKPKTSCGQG